jgi:hypothetical protein
MKPSWLIFAHSGEERRSEPVGPWLAGGPDGSIDGRRLVGRQSNGKDKGDALFGEPGAPYFVFHSKIFISLTKHLDARLIFVNISPFSKFETRPCRKNARSSLARLANRGHPAATGAGNGTLATKAFSYKVEEIGSEHPGEVVP